MHFQMDMQESDPFEGMSTLAISSQNYLIIWVFHAQVGWVTERLQWM